MTLRIIGPFLGASLLLLLSRVPAVVRLVPALGILTGPPGVVLLVLTAAIGVARWRSDRKSVV